MIGEEVRSLMEAAAGKVQTRSDAFSSVERTIARRRRRRKIATIVTAVCVSMSAGLLLWPAVGTWSGRESPSIVGASDPAGGAQEEVLPSSASGPFPPPADGVSALPLPVSRGPAGSSLVPVIFPDGTELEFVFGSGVELRGLGMRGATVGDIGTDVGNGCCARPIEYYYGTPEDTGFLGAAVLASYPGADGGEVLLQEGHPRDGAQLYLVYRFGPWTALVYDTLEGGMSEDEQRTWASNLVGIVHPSGALELRGMGSLSLEDPGYPAGPTMLIVGPLHSPEIFAYPTKCNPSPEVKLHEDGNGGVFAEWCPRGGLAEVRTSGDASFVQAVVDTLVVQEPSVGQ